MMDAARIADLLDAEATEQSSRATRTHVSTLRGIRGTPHGTIARVGAEAWRGGGWALPGAEDALNTLFGGAWEDGIVAVGLLAASTPDHPADALEIAREWLDRVDDVLTADALGWLVLGPAALAGGADLGELVRALKQHPRPAARRAITMMGMAMTPTEIEGPAAAPLRERVGTRDVQLVDAVHADRIAMIAHAFVKDDDPAVRKGLRRVLSAWAAADPDGAVAWLGEVRGGAPSMFREEIEKAARKARRPRRT